MATGECLALAAGGGVAGAGLGALLGSLFRDERWQEVARERLGVLVAPVASETPTVGVSLRF